MKSRKLSKKKSKNMTITYRDMEYNEVHSPSEPFNGFSVVRDTGKISHITIIQDSTEIGKISFRPTNEPLIFSVKFIDGYTEQRYNNGNVSSIYLITEDGEISGEFIRYDIAGKLITRAFYDKSREVTDEVKSLVSFRGSDEDFMTYEFSTDEEFNITMRYGGIFKFRHEFTKDSSKFDEIVRNCIQ